MLVHFSSSKDIVKITSTKQYNNHDLKLHVPGGKPLGFWVSVEGNGDGWYDWCIAAHFYPQNLKYRYQVKLKPDAKIFRISTPEEIDEFTVKYRDKGHPLNSNMFTGFGFADTRYIDYEKLEAEGYQGIIISPYIWSRRLTIGCSWYYGWDCASGCIWDADAVEEIVKLKGKIPRKTKRERVTN